VRDLPSAIVKTLLDEVVQPPDRFVRAREWWENVATPEERLKFSKQYSALKFDQLPLSERVDIRAYLDTIK
jgi:hypothetical protein